MSYLEDNKEVEFGGPRDPRKRWKRQARRDERRSQRKNKPKKPVRDFFFKLGQTGLFGDKPKACSTCGNKHRAEKNWKREKRKRDRYWGT